MNSKAETIIPSCLKQSIVQLWQKYENIRQKAQAGLLIQLYDKTLTFQNTNFQEVVIILDYQKNYITQYALNAV